MMPYHIPPTPIAHATYRSTEGTPIGHLILSHPKSEGYSDAVSFGAKIRSGIYASVTRGAPHRDGGYGD